MNVKFYFGVQAKFDALVEKDALALYFITDTQRLYKGDVLLGTGAAVTEEAAGLLSAEDYAQLKKLIAAGPAKTLTPVDGTISIENDKISVNVSNTKGNLVAVKDDGLFVAVESVSIDQVTGLKDELNSIKDASAGGIHYKGSVATVADLPADAAQGDLYEVLEDNSEWCFNGEKWFEYGNTDGFTPIAGAGIKIDDNKISVKISDEANGLVAVDGALSIALATKDTAGALSAVDKAFIDSIPDVYASKKFVKATCEQVKYEVASTPEGTLVNYGEKEIRIMCPADAKFVKQQVGTGGDPNAYYITFRTYAPNDNAVGYIEHLGDQSDSEILTNFSIDEYGRRYQPTWLGIAKYNEVTDEWTYYGANSSTDKYIGWDYQIDWYNADGVMIASDSIRINLSNENCHNSLRPYYMTGYATVDQIEAIQEAYFWGEL